MNKLTNAKKDFSSLVHITEFWYLRHSGYVPTGTTALDLFSCNSKDHKNFISSPSGILFVGSINNTESDDCKTSFTNQIDYSKQLKPCGTLNTNSILLIDSDGDVDIPRKKGDKRLFKSLHNDSKTPCTCSKFTLNFSSQNNTSQKCCLLNAICCNELIKTRFKVPPFFVASVNSYTEIRHVGQQLWLSSIVLADFLLFQLTSGIPSSVNAAEAIQNNCRGANQLFPAKTVLELGCGTGLLGPIYKQIFKPNSIILTDINEGILKLCECTQILNNTKCKNAIEPNIVHVRQLDWKCISNSSSLAELRQCLRRNNTNELLSNTMEQPESINKNDNLLFSWSESEVELLLSGKIDLITACDVLYDFETIDFFAHTVRRLLKINPSALMLLCQGYRLNIVAPWSDVPADVFIEYFKDTYIAEVFDMRPEMESIRDVFKMDIKKTPSNENLNEASIFSKPKRLQFFDLYILPKAPRSLFPVSNHDISCHGFPSEIFTDFLSENDEICEKQMPRQTASLNLTDSERLVFTEMASLCQRASKGLKDANECLDNCNNACYLLDISLLSEEAFKHIDIWYIKLHES